MADKFFKTASFSKYLPVILILVIVFTAFSPGLNSLFLFDDFPNLDALVYIQGESVLSAGFWEFVLGGNSGPTGRPVALFSFALQAGAWPDNPIAFKLVNLLIHCLNTVLIYLISQLITRALKLNNSNVFKVSLTVSLVWALHPIHTTVVLYAIQRMALLSNLFILLGIYSHLHIRSAVNTKATTKQLMGLTSALAICGILSLYSKENAPSLVFYLLVLEYTILGNINITQAIKKWRYIFLWAPAILTVILPVVFLDNLQKDFIEKYSYSAFDRLLSEGRILWQYLQVTLFPSSKGVSLFHDIEPSNSLFSPLTTLLSLLAWLVLVAIAFVKRRKNQLLLFAVCWFFAGHIIESTILPLELYFNHRNYLAFFGLLITGLIALFSLIPERIFSSSLKSITCLLYGALLFFQTFNLSSLWNEPVNLAENWYVSAPANSRNAEFYAISLAQSNTAGLQQAAIIYDDAFARDSGNFRLLMNRMTLSCSNTSITPPEDAFILQHLGEINIENRDLLFPIQQLISLKTTNVCDHYSSQLLETILLAIMESIPAETRGFYQFELARIKAYEGDNDAAANLLDSAFENTGDPGVLFTLSITLINAGKFEEALNTIDRAINRLQDYNNIRTGTRATKLTILGEMRNDVLGFINE